MSPQRQPFLIDEPEAAGPATMGTATPLKTGRGIGSTKSGSGKTAKSSRSPSPLLPLRDAYEGRIANLIEVSEHTRGRDELILSVPNIRLLLSLVEEYKNADMLRRHGLTIRSKLLFCGPAGCGKTLTAEVFAHELGLPLMVARLDAIISSFLGETASNLRKLFDEVTRVPSVLFLDEFDALARTRSDNAENNEMRRVVNSLLMMIDRYKGRGFLVAATNVERSLDPALWRRFDEVVLFELPGQKQILQLLRLKTRNFPAAFDISKPAAKLVGLSYADVERVCLNAIKRSILKGSRRIPETEFAVAMHEEWRRQKLRTRLNA